MPGTPGARTGLASILTGDAATAYRTTINAIRDWLEGNAGIVGAGLLGARPTSTPGSPGIVGRRYRATDVFATFRDTGTGWELESQTPPLVTALPTGTGIPFDGQEVYYLADATNGVVWHLKYRSASSSAYKWECIGAGAPMQSYFTGSENLTGTGTWQDAPSIIPQLTTPLAGDWLVDIAAAFNPQAGTSTNSSASAGLFIGATAPAADIFVATAPSNNAGNHPSTASRSNIKCPAVALGTVLKLEYQNVNTAPYIVAARSLSIRPIRVG